MATEATSETFATSTPIPNDELNTIETPSQDVTSEIPVINGTSEKDEFKQDIEHVEPNTMSAEVSVSGGSDTEASKTEASKAAADGDGKGHVRTSSTVKKFASFKPVSVNKKFLAAKVTATPSKLGEKVAAPVVPTAGSSSLRPRLVAKSGSGLRDSSAKTDATNGRKPGAPDASVVWNKNRPAPAVSAKAYTDEELKQQYGIHLATRMKTDDAGNKQANWADIDDDDDDWAPASMEWADGTKVTLPQHDDPPLPAPIPVASPAPKETFVPEVIKPKSPAPPQAPTSASASPIIKTTGLGSGRSGLVLKGASEKPTLVAKPPGPPTPVKSPWASLPPVDKAAPIAIDIPQSRQQQPPNRFGQRDPHAFESMPPPTKEIAADDFSRSSWREGSNTSRELYDSKSGRYEPVNDARRGSRNIEPRQPSLLQRPQHDGPAEPSAAFQTHRAGGQEGYGRRRTSSNVSGGSGNYGRRMSRGHDMPPPHELFNARRGSLAAVSDDPHSPRNYSPSGQYPPHQRGHQNQQWQSKASPVVSHPSPQSSHGQPIPPTEQQVPVPYQDPVEEQKKLMMQKIELARQRKLDEAAKEEAAKKERIRLRMEALGPAPEKMKKETLKEEKSDLVPTQIQARNPSNDEQTAPEASVEKKIDQSLRPSISEKQDRANGDPLSSSSQSQKYTQENRPAQPQQSWQNNSSVSDRPWAAPSSQQASRNVWGPPTNDKTLGNGTFNPELSRLPDMQSNHPGPIGPPGRGNGGPQRGQREPYVSRPAPIGPPSRQQPHGGNPKAQSEKDRVLASGWGSALSAINDSDRALREKAEKDRAEQRELEARGLVQGPVFNDTWREVDFDQDGARSGVKANHTTLHDTSAPGWNHQEDVTTRPIFEERAAIDEQELARRRNFDSIGSQPPQKDVWRPTSNMSNPVRGSRFFPSNNRDVRLEEQSFYDRPGSPSPPPPTMSDHPAWDGDGIPHVSLPRPSPVVKLPPALAPIGPPKPVSFAAAVTQPVLPLQSRNASSYQDVRREQPPVGDWQTRINSLIGRKPAHVDQSHRHEMAVDSSSKNTLEHSVSQYSATVSLPFSGEAEGSVISKPAAEICFEEQEMGSLPVVKVPSSAPPLAWDRPAAPKGGSAKRVNSTSIDAYKFSQQNVNNNNIFTIKLPGHEAKTVKSPMPRQDSNPRRGGGRGGSRQSSSSHPRGGRGRDSGNSFQSSAQDNSNAPSSSSGRGRANRGGGYAERNPERNWNRQQSTPLHT